MRLHPLPAVAAFALALPALFAQTPNANPRHDPRIHAIIHSLQQVKDIRETQLSPDGQLIAWTIRGEGVYLAPLSNPRQVSHITACASRETGKEDNITWSPDSKTLAFLSDCTPGQKIAIFTDDIATPAAPHPLAQLNGFAKSLQYSPNGKYLSFLYVEGATRPSGALAAMKPPSGVIGVENIEVQRVATVDAATGNLSQVTPANLHVYEYDWSPDSSRLAYIAAPPPGEDNWWTAKLYTQPVMPGASPIAGGRAVFDPSIAFDPNTTTGPLHGLQIAVPRWSPDGKQIAFIGGLMSDQGATGGNIYVIPSTGGTPKNLAPDSSQTASWIDWRSPHRLLVTWIKAGEPDLGEIDPANGKVISEYDPIPADIGSGGLLLSLSVANNGKIAYVKSSFANAPEVYVDSLGEPAQQVTHLNDSLKPSWGKSESIEWTNEGFHVQGWLLYPADYNPAKKYPLIVYVHGGPSYANMPRWPSPNFGPAPFSALGYFVLMPNPRGSFGEGEKFTQANRKDFGYGDLRDILAGVDAVIKDHPVDPHRVGITGWSYGGFMTMFAITQTHRFAAAVAGAGLSDWLSYYGENSIDEWMIPFFGASVYDDPAVYARSSAINYVKNAKTPTLIVVGDRDGECPAPQSFEFWHALRAEHVPTELVVYPNEGHGFENPEHRIDVLERALAWFDQYMP
jgi:dipeptidyl aminopeptidase/acylaminoacyl peptidase